MGLPPFPRVNNKTDTPNLNLILLQLTIAPFSSLQLSIRLKEVPSSWSPRLPVSSAPRSSTSLQLLCALTNINSLFILLCSHPASSVKTITRRRGKVNQELPTWAQTKMNLCSSQRKKSYSSATLWKSSLEKKMFLTWLTHESDRSPLSI